MVVSIVAIEMTTEALRGHDLRQNGRMSPLTNGMYFGCQKWAFT